MAAEYVYSYTFDCYRLVLTKEFCLHDVFELVRICALAI